MGQTAVIVPQIVDVAARSLLGNNTASAAACQTVSFATASTGNVLTVQSDGSVAFAAPAAGGITSLNGLTAATQVFAVGTTGTDVAFVSATGTHTLNIPNASATARGLVTTGNQTISGEKIYTNRCLFLISGNANSYFGSAGFPVLLADSSVIAWSNLYYAGNQAGLQIARSRQDVVGVRRSTNPCGVDVFNTYTSDTSFERLSIAWSGNVCTIATEKGSAGGTLRGLTIGDATTALLGFYGVTPVDQPATVTDPTGGGTVDAEARTAINAIIDRLQELGLIA